MSINNLEIILVEDNQDDAILTKRALKAQNPSVNIVHLKNGEEALDFIFKGKEFEGKKFSDNPKIILLDLKMPKVDGIEVLKRIKEDPVLKFTPVIILTSSSNDPDIKKTYEIGANSYIIKPIEFENFSKTVEKVGTYWLLLNKNFKSS